VWIGAVLSGKRASLFGNNVWIMGCYTRPLTHFFTRCSATTYLRVMSLIPQGYTGDGSLLRNLGCGWGG
jgi:hypothetical protein